VSEVAAAGLEPEDEARAAYYGLIARLFYAAPDEAVLAQMLHANAFEGSDAPIARAWRELAAAAKTAFPVVLENEHTELFVGTGKAEVTPYLTHYTIQYATDTPLVDVRQQLRRWGIARRESASEPEDHISGLCEAMRFAIAVQQRADEEQKAFFDRFLYRGAIAFCDAVSASPKAGFYRLVARFTRAFLDLENEAFRML
jgi:TorA maturation chaperone TorD